MCVFYVLDKEREGARKRASVEREREKVCVCENGRIEHDKTEETDVGRESE